MNWSTLLSTYRIGQTSSAEPSVRSDFQRDGDRLIFSAAFRRMQDKTQVFPLEKNDYVRTRLTHSLEVSCVGRSLGSSVGQTLLKKQPQLSAAGIRASDIGDIVSAACLAHDIGNPPFGHFGEQAMRDYFAHPEQSNLLARLNLNEQADLLNIEGNAQGFRICNRLESPDNIGGLRLTAATLASASKYPCTASGKSTVIYKKNGCYHDDINDFGQIFAAVGLPAIDENVWQRHPLSFLMEAADDICYLIVDLEDAYQVGQIAFNQAAERLADLAETLIDTQRMKYMQSQSDQLSYLRAKAIGKLVHETVDVFWEVEGDLLSGKRQTALLTDLPSYHKLEEIRHFSHKNIYTSRPVVEIQVAGHRVLNGLMQIFCQSIANHFDNDRLSRYDEMILALLPSRYRRYNHSLYQQLLGVCDYITGMTDSYAVSLYKKLTGISLPVD